jgi:hypothetical protein
MIVTVTTARDRLPNLQRFVRGNLAGGVDHMVVVLEEPTPDVVDWLEAQPEVTPFVADADWWQGPRPERLNMRQWINANLVRRALAEVVRADWLFHLDGDEVAQIDRDVLAGVPARHGVVRLGVLEAVSRPSWPRDPTWFKRDLTDGELALLVQLGVLTEPRNKTYFRGHRFGKIGMRPDTVGWIGLHNAVDDELEPLPHKRFPGLELLHYESWSLEDFDRKWTNLATAGSRPPNFQDDRGAMYDAFAQLSSMALPAEVRERAVRRIYERACQDQFETLRDLGLLVEVDPAEGKHQPTPLSPAEQEQLRAAITSAGGSWRTYPILRNLDEEERAAMGL